MDYWYAHMKETFSRFGISFDNFSRTSTPLHARNTQLFYQKLKEGGYISEAESKQMYSPTEGRFLPDRYVEGTCPVRLQGGPGRPVRQLRKLVRGLRAHRAAFQDHRRPRRGTRDGAPLPRPAQVLRPLESVVAQQEHWRDSVKNFVLGMIGGGLEKRPITRDIEWGVPIPEPGFEDKRFYVWFDAPIGYVSSTMEWAEFAGDPDCWRRYWQEPETRLVHFIGKDNTVFHAVVWPAMLMGTAEDGEEPLILPHDVLANEFMNLEVLVNGVRACRCPRAATWRSGCTRHSTTSRRTCCGSTWPLSCRRRTT